MAFAKMSRSVHDNFLTSYLVDSKSKTIRFQTEYQDGGEPFEFTDVVFEGVEDHVFINAVMPSIIFDIEEVDPSFAFNRDEKLIIEGNKVGGWPSLYEGSIADLITKIGEDGLKVFQLQSSHGMDGWVVCKSCTFVESSSANNSCHTTSYKAL